MLQIENKTNFSIPTKQVRDIFLYWLRREKIDKNSILELRVTTNAVLRRLNRVFRDKDRATDVLSFPIHPSAKKTKLQPLLLGSIVIGKGFLNNLTSWHGSRTAQEEFLFLFEHGLKHILGHHHKE